MALTGDLQTWGASSAKMYADQARNNPRVNNMYAASRKEAKAKHKRDFQVALALILAVGTFLFVGFAMKASQKAGYVSDSHGNVSYEQMLTFEEPGSGITRGN